MTINWQRDVRDLALSGGLRAIGGRNHLPVPGLYLALHVSPISGTGAKISGAVKLRGWLGGWVSLP